MVLAVEKVRQRLMRATAQFNKAKADYAVAGGNAVAWVATVDPASCWAAIFCSLSLWPFLPFIRRSKFGMG
jgi:hypothetical protein